MKTQITNLNATDSNDLQKWFSVAFAPFTFELEQNGYRLQIDERLKSNIDFFVDQNKPTTGDEENWLEVVTAEKIRSIRKRFDPIDFAFIRASFEIYPSLTHFLK